LNDLVLWLDTLRMTDLGKVGGKNASLGEMIGNLAKLGVSVPGGFATTADAFQQYLDKISLRRMVSADDVAAMALFLCSPGARNVTVTTQGGTTSAQVFTVCARTLAESRKRRNSEGCNGFWFGVYDEKTAD